jgi:hypothetical protein
MAQANQLMPGEWDNVFGPSAANLSKTQDQAFEDKTRLNAQLDPMALNYNSRVNMGRRIGKSINTLFGGQSTDPALRKAEIIDQIFKTLSPEELKNPAQALSTIADRLEEQGYPRDAAEARMKSTEIAQQTMINEDTVKTSGIKRQQAVLERIAQGANGILGMYDQVGPELQDQLYNQQVDMIEKEVGVEAANQLRNVKPTERRAMLKKMVDEADKESSRSKETIANEKIAASQKAYEFKAGVAKAMQTEKENNRFILQANNLKFKASEVFLENLGDRIGATDDALKNQADLLAMYSDPMKTPTLSESERTIAVNQITQNMKTLEATKGKLNAMQGSAGQAIQNPVLAGPGSTVAATAIPGGTAPAATQAAPAKTQAKTTAENDDYIQAETAAKLYPADAARIWAEYDKDHPGVRGATTKPAAPAAETKPKLSVEEQKKVDFEAAFLAKLNQESDYQKIANAGKAILKPLQDFWVKYENDVKAQGELIDAFAKHAKAKLNDKAYVAQLSPNAKAKLEELANDSSVKSMERQQEGTKTMLALAGTALTAGISTVTIKGLLKMSAAKAAKNAYKTRTPLKIETKMKGLPEKVKISQEKVDRAAGLREKEDPALRFAKPLFQ